MHQCRIKNANLLNFNYVHKPLYKHIKLKLFINVDIELFLQSFSGMYVLLKWKKNLETKASTVRDICWVLTNYMVAKMQWNIPVSQPMSRSRRHQFKLKANFNICKNKSNSIKVEFFDKNVNYKARCNNLFFLTKC